MRTIKTFAVGVAIILLSIGICYQTKAQNAINPDSLKKRLDVLMASKEPSDQQLLNERLSALAASHNETSMSIAGSYYYQIKNAKASDSVFAVEIALYPKGQEARIRAQQAITRIKSLNEMETAYQGFIKIFPPESYPKLPFGEDRLVYDRIRITIAIGYAKEKNIAKVSYYTSLMDADFWKGKAYSELSDTFYVAGDLANAALYQQKAVESTLPFAEGKDGNSFAASFAAKSYADECRTYAQLLYEQKKYSKALTYIQIAIKAAKRPGADYNYTDAKILAALNRNQEAYSSIEAAVRSSEATQEMADLFQVLYVKVKGSNAGLDAYQVDIRKGITNNLRKRLVKHMLNEPAANFTLTDLQGNRVTLDDLRGKIVILDFWATWCGPCKASFPAMQMAVDKYKNDPDVRFLFIHTWERTPTPAEDAKAYIAGMKYSFQVLMDIKDPETKANKVVNSYNVASIPAKFVIDGKGNIRFKLTGFNGSKEAALDEITMMIDMIRLKG